MPWRSAVCFFFPIALLSLNSCFNSHLDKIAGKLPTPSQRPSLPSPTWVSSASCPIDKGWCQNREAQRGRNDNSQACEFIDNCDPLVLALAPQLLAADGASKDDGGESPTTLLPDLLGLAVDLIRL